MMKLLRIVFITYSILTVAGCQSTQQNEAKFEYFEYKGKDARFEKNIDVSKEYLNPILAGFYPDPSICRKGDDYFMVNSSFSYYPGVPIFHSKDLVNWKQIGFVLNRISQLKLDGIRLSGGIYAPAIEYNKHNDTFYMVTTCVDGIGNFVVKTKDPLQGDWSEPIQLPKVGGIDPSLFFDDDGRGYLVHNDAPDRLAKWDGHRAIWMHEYDVNTDTTSDNPIVLLDAGINPSEKPIWIEGPHIYKINGSYYLMAAEGGTSVNHSEVILKSDNVKGPYKSYKNNPILTQRNLDPSRNDIVTCVGHADLIDTPQGEWYSIFLGCRPYRDGHYNTGRETFLLPVSWESGFPVILEKGKAVPTVVPKINLLPDKNILTGNFTWRDDFTTDSLDYRWLMIRSPQGKRWWSIKNGALSLNPMQKTIADIDNPAYLGHRQQHIAFEVTTEMTFDPKTDSELAGLVCFQNEAHNVVLGKTLKEGHSCIVLERTHKEKQLIASISIPSEYKNSPLTFKIEGNGDKYSFYVSYNKTAEWVVVAENVDATILSTETARGFVGTTIGIYATAGRQ